jgi:hypothetical protein
MIRYIFIAAFVYIVVRMAQVVLRLISSGARGSDAPDDRPSPGEPKPLERFEDIRDADFEDVTSPKPSNGKPQEGENRAG